MIETALYPHFSIPHPKNPNRNWAFPILGGLAKIIILIPVFIEVAVLAFYVFILQIMNSAYVLLNRKYWKYCFDTTVGTMNLITKTMVFFGGLTDKYPGFDLKLNGTFELKFTMPTNPSPLFAFPLFGGIGRGILLIPFAIYSQVISNGARVGIVGSSIPVFFKGKYPLSTYELAQDATRLGLSEVAYFAGISDIYPSFKINMNNQTIKIFLIIIGTLIMISHWKFNDHKKTTIRDNFMQNQPAPLQQLPNYQNYPNYR